MSKYWNELLCHWRSGFCFRVTSPYGTGDRQMDGQATWLLESHRPLVPHSPISAIETLRCQVDFSLGQPPDRLSDYPCPCIRWVAQRYAPASRNMPFVPVIGEWRIDPRRLSDNNDCTVLWTTLGLAIFYPQCVVVVKRCCLNRTRLERRHWQRQQLSESVFGTNICNTIVDWCTS